MANVSPAEKQTLLDLTDHLLGHPNSTVPELVGKIPDGDVVVFVNDHPLFFTLTNDTPARVQIKQHRSNIGYKWRMCSEYYCTNQCTRGQVCNFWHGPTDPRDRPQQQNDASATTTPDDSQSDCIPALPPANTVQPIKQTPSPPPQADSQPNTNPTTKSKLSKNQRKKANQKARKEAEKNNQMQLAASDSLPAEVPNVTPVIPSVIESSPVPLPIAALTPKHPKRNVEGKNCLLVPKEKNVKELMNELMQQKVIAVDCEGVNLGANGKLCLIQIATNFNVYVIDMCVGAAERENIVASLNTVFMNDAIKKILHDARNDNEALYSVGIINECFEDTQILYGLMTSLRGKPEKKIGLKELMQHYGYDHELKTAMKANYKSDPALWAYRPLTENMIEYAACDVANLAVVYKKLKEDIENEIMMVSRNYARPKELKLMEKTFADAIKIQLDVKLRLFFTKEKKPDRRDLNDVFLEVAPVGNNTNERSDNESEEKRLLDLFPEEIRWAIEAESRSTTETLIEIVIDKGRVPRIRFTSSEVALNVCGRINDVEPFVSNILLNSQRTDFSRENRIGIEGSLHRISAIKNADNRVIGLTYRIGRHLPRSAEIITDLIARVAPSLESTVDHAPQNTSILLLGPPGVGKTTLLREISRLLADEYEQRVMIVDTSNEIGGDGDIAHHCIGRARRMPVVDKASQHNTMVEAVQNHNPTVIIIDEIGTPKEVLAAKTISQRGVSLIGTAHGTSFDSLMKNPELVPLLGGIREVFLSDREAIKNEDGTKSKVKHERGGSPTFNIIIEIITKNKFRIYDDVALIVDAKLSRKPYVTELRWFEEDRMYSMLEQHNPLGTKKGNVHFAYVNNDG